MKVHLTKDEACDTLDKLCELFPACRGELQEIKQFVKRSKYKGRKDNE